MRDAAIIGAGPTGMSAAIYLHRAGHSLVLLEANAPGGLLRNANLVENYPGFPNGIRGEDLAVRITDQLEALGIRITRGHVRSVACGRGCFRVRTKDSEWRSRVAIVATGTSPEVPRISGLKPMIGRKAFFDIVSMPSRSMEPERVIVIGGGDAAFDYSLNLAGRGHEVTLMTRSEPKCLPLLYDRAIAAGVDVKVGLIARSVKEVPGGLVVGCLEGAKRISLRGDKALIACGRKPNVAILSTALKKRINPRSRIPESGMPGLYLAGDIVRGRNRQASIAVGDGVLAAMLAQEYLDG